MLGGDSELEKPSTRKDTATTFTRKLVFDAAPREILAPHYRGVEEVSITSDCLDWELSVPHVREHEIKENARLLREMITTLSRERSSSTRSHVSVKSTGICESGKTGSLFPSDGQHSTDIDATYDFPNLSIWSSLDLAYRLRGVVRYNRCHLDFDGNNAERPQDRNAKELGENLEQAMRRYDGGLEPGCLYLCGLPQMVLTPEEIEAAGDDVDEVALLKVHNAIPLSARWRYRPHPTPIKWQDFQSKVKLVGPGFRPTRADLAAEV
jgi:hypothetical protein